MMKGLLYEELEAKHLRPRESRAKRLNQALCSKKRKKAIMAMSG